MELLKIVILLGSWVIIESYTHEDDFEYTVCRWYNSRCIQIDIKEYVDDDVTSEWPPGPYALLTSSEGCPETRAEGWRSGYLSFTWKHPQTLTMVANDCDVINKTFQSNDCKKTETANFTKHHNCCYSLTPDKWPNFQSPLLGPFSRYQWRLNFCFKIKNTSVHEGQYSWPAGSYSVFGDDSSCPAEFTASERAFTLPPVTKWSSNGDLPSFSVMTTDTENSVTLILTMCEHRIVETEANGVVNGNMFASGTFIFVMNEDNSTCPQILNKTVDPEMFQLHTEVINDHVEIFEIFEICHYRPKALPIDLDGYLYMPQNSEYFPRKPAFSILNPTLIHGDTLPTTKMSRSPNDLSWRLLPQYFDRTTTSWLLVDLGRNFIVVGLQLNRFRYEIKSKEYSGTLNVTINGLTCQRWDVQTPHSHTRTVGEMFPENSVSGAKNYCRDPSDYGKIWCYTQLSDRRWELCAEKIISLKEEKTPISRCFISEDRWRLDDFGGISCQHMISSTNVKLTRRLEGRYVYLIGRKDIANKQFNSLTENVEVLISGNILYDGRKCKIDLGMGDESIYDHQISASSWLPQYPPTSSRPFSSGWCGDTSDTNPFITVDMLTDTIVESITFFNWKLVEENVDEGIYTEKYFMIGSKKVLVNYITADNNSNTNLTYNFGMFLPIEQPQTFFHSPILARYITIYIVESMTTNSKCLRFELQGCKSNARSELVSDIGTFEMSSKLGEESVTYNNLKILRESSVISSIAHPSPYAGGVSYTWIIDFTESKYIQLVFTEISFNLYKESEWNQCRDTISLLPAYKDDRMYIDEEFNDIVALVETHFTYMTLTFTTCRPTSKMRRVGNGFEAIVRSKGTPTCFSARTNTKNVVVNYCSQRSMFLSSLSRFNFPVSNAPEQWNIHVKNYAIRLKILNFNVRCDSGSALTINDRFSGQHSYCNLHKAPVEWLSGSDTVYIKYEKGLNLGSATSRRISTQEGFKAMYTAFHKAMTHLINLQKLYTKAADQLNKLQEYWDPSWKNATLLTYQGCSKKFGKCYYIFSGAITTWKEAGNVCWIRQSTLVSIHSDVELELVIYLLRNFMYLDNGRDSGYTAFYTDETDPTYFSHIGLSLSTSETGMKKHLWEDGSPVTFSAWKADEPSVNKDCTRMSFHLFNTNNTWESENCETGLANYFVCEQRVTDEELSTVYPHIYIGTLNVTVSGIPCQRWDTQYPHEHSYNKDDWFPELDTSRAENFCRDPGRIGYLWCYTVNPNIRFESCSEEGDSFDVPVRPYNGKLSRTSSGKTCQRWDMQTPHEHNFHRSSLFPDNLIEDAANHCRDPSHSGMLWCFTTDPLSRWETCNLEDTAADRCYFTHSAYSGQWNKTRTGKVCQLWESQSPHKHELFLDNQFPDGSVAEAYNYCRDPYAEGFLWCFTMDPATKSEPCVFDYKYQVANYTTHSTYTNEMFSCANGEAILKKYFCDGVPNCLDLSDEASCTKNVHRLMLDRGFKAATADTKGKYSLFQCDSKEWVSLLARCNRVIDCIDASDEINCSLSHEKSVCSKGEYTCEDGGCIHISQMCDFIVDCEDGSDENCDYPLCSQTEDYHCRNQQCIPVEHRCNVYENCLDGSDEENCDKCNGNSFHCDMVRCIPNKLVCDNYIDCKDGTDEQACEMPVYLACEDWWNAGYRTSGIYKLNKTEAECNFDAMEKEGTIYTTFDNFEVTSRYRHEQVHFDDKDLLMSDFITRNIITTHFLNHSYCCFQNITQSCIPAYDVLSENENHILRNTNRTCECITTTFAPFNDMDVVSLKCEDDEPVINNIQMLYEYENFLLSFKRDFPRDMELKVGPVVCSNVEKLEIGNKNLSIVEKELCLFDIDPAGFIIGSRSGQHLQGCEKYGCPGNTVKCPDSFCLPLKFICDGVIQCPGGQDEEECGCLSEDCEVILLYEDMKSKTENEKIQKIAAQFYSNNSIVRELRFKTSTQPNKLEFDHLFLDISDTVINPYRVTDREFTCNYSILASDFVNRIEFSKASARAVLFLQTANELNSLAEIMFGNVKSKPEFLIYRVIQDPFYETSNLQSFPIVTDVVLKSWTILHTIGAKYFPELCKETATMFCPNEYKCASSKTCLHMEQICDGQAQCLHGDDERLCEYACPENCTCLEYTTDCSFASINNNTLPYFHRNSRLLELSGNTELRGILLKPMLHFPFLISLNISMCDIEKVAKGVFQSVVNLRVLDLSFNNLVKIPKSAFIGLRKLKMLKLQGNRDIRAFEPYSFNGLSGIRSLHIVGAKIHIISSHTFDGLNLDELTLSGNVILQMEDDVFSGLNVKIIDMETNKIDIFDKDLFRGVSGISTLHTPAYKYCCVRPNYVSEKNCYPEEDEFSSCADLLRVSALQTMLWLIGILSLVGNILSVLYRLVFDRERLKVGFGIFVTNLAVADFLMGIYLMIIAVADTVYRKRYIFMDDYWRNSAWCTLAGFLSTVSSEASVFFLCLITLDRLLVIKYPFGQVRFNMKNAWIFSCIVWMVSGLVGLIPILYKGYFHDRFYSKSAVCIALPLTRDRPPGWLYSMIIFVGVNFVTFCLLALGQVVIYSDIKRATSSLIRSSSRKGNGWTGQRQELTVARNLLLVVTTDFLCWFPIGCMGMMSLSGHVIPGEVYAWTAVFILPVNSALNPHLYTLTAILRQKKAKDHQDTHTVSAYPSLRYDRKTEQFNDLFRYLIIKPDIIGQTFTSLNNLGNNDTSLSAKDVLNIVKNLSRYLCFLHKNSLMVQLNGSVVLVNRVKGKVLGDVQIRQEPRDCYTTEKEKENMYQLGQIVRLLLAISKKTREM